MKLDKKYGPWALIIGGSEAFGLGLATRLAAQGINVAITGRKRSSLDAAAAKVRAVGKAEVRTLSQDMTAPDMMDNIKGFTKDLDVGLLIYNAGGMDRITGFLGDTIEGHLHTIKINCEGPTRLAHHFGGLMKKRGGGGIVLMGSGGALAGADGVQVYCATKAFDMLLAEGLWYELRDFNISVVCPLLGRIRTPTTEKLFQDESGADPEETADEILANIENGPTVFTKSIQQMIPLAWGLDRRKAVTMIGDVAKDMFSPKTNRKPFNPNAVVR